MRRLIVLAAALAALAVPATGSAATERAQCSNSSYINSVLRIQARVLYGTELMESLLFREAGSAFSQALRQHERTALPCSSALRSVRSTFHSGMSDWYTATTYMRRGNLTRGLSIFKRGTAKINFATNQLKNLNRG